MGRKTAKAAPTAAARGVASPRPITTPPPPTPGTIKVEATQMGYFDHTRRRPGDVFTIRTEQEFSARWMRKVDPDTREHTTTPNQAIAREHGQILKARHAPPGMIVGPDDVPADLPTGDHNPLGEDRE